MDKVIVKVRGQHSGVDGQASEIEMVTLGRHYEKRGTHYVLYEDNMDNMAISTVLRIEPGAMKLTRGGAVNQEQYFRENFMSTTEYATPFGSMKLDVLTEKIDIVYGSVSGKIDIDYAMAINDQWYSDNALHIEVNAVDVAKLN